MGICNTEEYDIVDAGKTRRSRCVILASWLLDPAEALVLRIRWQSMERKNCASVTLARDQPAKLLITPIFYSTKFSCSTLAQLDSEVNIYPFRCFGLHASHLSPVVHKYKFSTTTLVLKSEFFSLGHLLPPDPKWTFVYPRSQLSDAELELNRGLARVELSLFVIWTSENRKTWKDIQSALTEPLDTPN